MPSRTGGLAARVKSQVSALRAIQRTSQERRQWLRQRHAASPAFRQAVAADVAANLVYRGENRDRAELSRTELVAEALRLAWTSDAFAAQLLYRGRVAMMRRGVPVLPRVCHFLSMSTSQVCIGDPVVVGSGLYLPHGQVVVDGVTEVGSHVILFPWTTIGLRAGNFTGPVIRDGAHVGTGAKVIGSVTVGPQARVGANAVVVRDVAPGATVAGVPAKPTHAQAGAAR